MTGEGKYVKLSRNEGNDSMYIIPLLFCLVVNTLTPEALLEKIDNARVPDNYEVQITIKNHLAEDRDIEYTIKALVKKDKGSYFEFTAPAREKGRRFLLIEDNLWMYVPGMSKTIRLSPKDNFMGTDFSNSDMMQSHFGDNYAAQRYEELNGKYLLYLEARTPSVPYKRIEIEVNRSDFTPREVRYYTLSGKLFRRMLLDSIKTFEGEEYPSYMKMENLMIESSFTEATIVSLKKRQDIPNRYFNPLYLKK